MKPEDDWQRRATAEAIAAARRVADETVKGTALIGRLSDREWGWVIIAALFGWIKTRAEQATSEGRDTELALRVTGEAPEPWDAGAVASILPELADASDIDWSRPLTEWPPQTMTRFLVTAFGLIRKAVTAREFGRSITSKSDDQLDGSIPL
jgi:hypothetical protein